MNKTLRTTLTIIAVLALAGVVFFAGSMYARAYTFGPSMMGDYGNINTNAYGPGEMMANGRSNYQMGLDMMGNSGNMMNSYDYYNTNATPLTIDQTKTAAEKYLANLNNSDLKIAEIMVFDNNSYVVIKETSTGTGAFELLVDPSSQIAYPEHGPNMMWNVKYSGLNHQYMMGGNSRMMGGNGGMMGNTGNMMSAWDTTSQANVSAEMTVTPQQAIEFAQKYIDTNIPGATAAADPIQFYGYYTLDFEKDGKVTGMLSVNGYSGQIFLHTWHGTFIEESAIQ
ncbi:MAG: hypothetical protein ABI904_14130 [Chloroflexota bacterium]